MSDPISRLNASLEGRYRVTSELGAGGMATVYLADDLKHERKVALKVLRPELAAVVGADRFLAEIKTTAGLQHPHILPLHDSGEADKLVYYVMPAVEGESLRDKLDREHQLPVEEAVRIASDMAKGLDYAHRHGVVHRDIKPGNVLLHDGQPVISDFGIALAVSAGGGGRLTETGLSLGTPHYMSPEQATGDQSVGAGTDIYALGCVLYELLTGGPPYTGTTAQAILGSIIQGEPVSATEQRPSVPANVDAAIRRATEKLPADRFATASEFAAALADPSFRHGEGVTAAAGAPQSRWNALSITLAAVAVITTTVALREALGRGPQATTTVSRHVLSAAEWTPQPGQPFGEYSALAPDGSAMILPLEDQLGLKMRNSTEITPIAGTEAARNVVFSPDGQSIAYAVGTEVFRRPLFGGEPRRIAQGTEPPPYRVAIAWLEDRTMIYEPSDNNRPGVTLVHMSEDGGDPIRIVNIGAPAFWVHGLPAGRGLLVVTSGSSLKVVDLGDGTVETVLEGVVRAWYLPTGHVVYVRLDGDVLAVPFDLENLQLAGSSLPVFGGVRAIQQTADMHLASDGTLLYVEGQAATSPSALPVWVGRDGESEPLDPALTGVFWSPDVSPDGRRIAFEHVPSGDDARHIRIYDIELGELTTLTSEGRSNRHPFWSADGREVGFSSDRAGVVGLYARPIDLSAPARRLQADSTAPLFEGGWTPDRSQLVYRRGTLGEAPGLTIESAAAESSSPPTRLLNIEGIVRNPALSPDGRWLAYSSDESGRFEVYIRPFAGQGGSRPVSMGGGSNPVWGPDGDELFYLDYPVTSLLVARFRLEPTFAVASRDTVVAWPYRSRLQHPHWDISPIDGRILAIQPPLGAGDRVILVQNFLEELRALTDDN